MQVAPSDGSEINDAYEFKKQAKPTSTSDPTYGHVEHGKAARMPIADAVDCMNKMILSLSALLHKLSCNS